LDTDEHGKTLIGYSLVSSVGIRVNPCPISLVGLRQSFASIKTDGAMDCKEYSDDRDRRNRFAQRFAVA
jgi:hypothetical protein